MAIPRLRDYQGPAILSYGFRPFFFFGSLFSALAMMAWLPVFYGTLELSSLFGPIDWHVHEIFFGYLAAIISGFLFTAVPNWTGRMPIQGRPLLLLAVIWAAGRIAVTFSVYLGWALTMIIDIAFLTAIVFVIGNEVIAGKNWRNLKVLIPVSLFWAANIGFHLEAHFFGITDYSQRLAMAVAISLIMLIGGRIVPSFTRNYLVRRNPGRLPAPFSRFDALSIALGVAAFAVWIVLADGWIVAGFMGGAGIMQFARLARWAGDRTRGDFLVAILHISYLFIPVGFVLIALANIWPAYFSPVAGMHAFGVGAVGSMTLSVMIRATFGHTGRPLKADISTKLILTMVWLSAISRIAAALYSPGMEHLLHIAATTWVLAFLGFSLAFAHLLLRPKGT
ncbi:short-chain dehydrogenase [Sneathiella chungangensis]|uniref:Short-chain dehydrogenase n=1 Tax=Sneathiella chungangensis TaxID=1418234 RepID=A0A845MGK6_9PROT|nr:NnrS family protein [Sneathiella chungangensis]MZR22785.1 short-chain dehydrogenase [Sneathiella chungangensis]